MVKLFRFYHLFFGLVFAAAFIYDTVKNIDNLVDFFSYFTIISILIVTLVFIWMALFDADFRIFGLPRDGVRIAATVYVVISSLIFILLLAGRPDVNPTPWISFVYHKLAPIAALGSWMFFPPIKRVDPRIAFYFAIYPVFYVTYTYLRGFATGWYPYYFFDPSKSNFFEILRFSIFASIFGFAISLVLIFVGNVLLGLKPKH